MVNTIKIGVFIPCFWPERNGIINYVDGLYSHINKIDDSIKTTIVTFDTANTKQYFKEENEFNVYRLPCIVLLGGTYVIPSISGIIKFIKLIRSENFDLINTHTRFFISSLLGLIWAKTKKVPLIHTEHGSSFVKQGSFITRVIARIYDETLGRLVFTNSSQTIGVSSSCVSFAKLMGAENTAILYNSLDHNFWKPDPKILRICNKIAFCGRIIKAKGLQDLIYALDKIKQVEWELVIIGAGNYATEIKVLITQLKLQEHIVFAGDLDRNKIKETLNTVGIFVNPSYTEGLPTSVLEAGAMGCAIIATNVGGTNEIINDGENGYLVPLQKDSNLQVAHITKHLTDLLNNPEKQLQFGNSIAKFTSQKFDWEITAQQFIKTVKSLS